METCNDGFQIMLIFIGAGIGLFFFAWGMSKL